MDASLKWDEIAIIIFTSLIVLKGVRALPFQAMIIKRDLTLSTVGRKLDEIGEPMSTIVDKTGRKIPPSNLPTLDPQKLTVEDLLSMQAATKGRGAFLEMNDLITVMVMEIKRTKSKMAELEAKNANLEKKVVVLLEELLSAQQ